MIGVKDAVGAATRFAEELYGPREDLGLTLEEVELSSDDRHWLITLGLVDRANPFAALAGGLAQRDYKIFKVDAETGEVVSMKIRSVA